jgi:hypothetical protein
MGLPAGRQGLGCKNKGRVETQPRFKIQYPMKNHCKDAFNISKRCTLTELFFMKVILR